MGGVSIRGLRFAYGAGGAPTLGGIDLDLQPGELFCLLGPSGCGKSTLLRLVGGYLKPSDGTIDLAGREVSRLPPEERNIGMVFQNYALFPHLSALDNVAFPLRVRGIGSAARRGRAGEMLQWSGLSADELRRRPGELSGGQQQRVALARALVSDPVLLMLDEPFANLDRILRERLREEMRDLQRRTGATTILVTHDREEAFAIADRIAVMQSGRLVQTGRPREVHERPSTPFVADFLGHRNLYPIEEAGEAALVAAGARFPSPDPVAGKSPAPGDWLLLRSADIRLHGEEVGGALPATLAALRFAGSHTLAVAQLDGGPCVEAFWESRSPAPPVGSRIWLETPPGSMFVIGKEGGPS